MNWIPLQSAEQIEQIKERSCTTTCMIFKHSTRCEISSIAKYRLESDWGKLDQEIEPYYLDLLAYRQISGQIADEFSVHHASPQVLLIRDGECFFDTSHLDISIEELMEAV